VSLIQFLSPSITHTPKTYTNMGPYNGSKLPPPPQPTRAFFDPFHSSSTGHQRAENRLSGSTSWRDSRSYKLMYQFKDVTGRGGERHLSDLVGAGSENFCRDGRKESGDWEVGAPGLREKGWQDIRKMFGGNQKRSSDGMVDRDGPGSQEEKKKKRRRVMEKEMKTELKDSGALDVAPLNGAGKSSGEERASTCEMTKSSNKAQDGRPHDPPPQLPQIFRNLTMYLNGSTAPLVSDHKLKQLFAQHGGNASISLGRRTVTHVVLGEKCGGGLASSKIQREVGGQGIKYVTAQWVLDSIQKGVRQPEARYMPKDLGKRIGGSGQTSVRSIFFPEGQ